MNALRLTTIAMTCLMLVFPAFAAPQCCSVVPALHDNCSCCCPAEESCCSADNNQVSCCTTNDSDDANCSDCNCIADADSTAVPAPNSTTSHVLETCWCPLNVMPACSAASTKVDSFPDRPPNRHNLRQAILSVWRN